MEYSIREYRDPDETSWVRCRALAFLDTSYFDAVEPRRPKVPDPGFALVAVSGDGAVIGMLDVEIERTEATIETIAVHPDRRSAGIAGALLDEAKARLAALGVTSVDAWTRDDPWVLQWYRSRGFTECDHYLHVYADIRTDAAEPDRAVGTRRPGLRPVKVFAHAKIEDDARLRSEFSRVHVCRRFVLAIEGRA